MADFDIVNVCMSKGMGCPIGSLIVGTEADIRYARNIRKMVGGAMRQTGVFTAAGLVALQDWREKLAVDHANAKWIATELAGLKGIICDAENV